MPADADALVLANLPLVKHIIGRMGIRRTRAWDPEDCYQWGVIGLMDAARRFDPAKGAHFSTYAYLRIRSEIIDNLRRMDGSPRCQRGQAFEAIVPSSLDRIVSAEDEDSFAKFLVDEQAPDPEAVAVAHDEARELVAALAKLAPRERAALVLHYGRGQTQKVIASMMGISKSRASQLCKAGENRLRMVLDARSQAV